MIRKKDKANHLDMKCYLIRLINFITWNACILAQFRHSGTVQLSLPFLPSWSYLLVIPLSCSSSCPSLWSTCLLIFMAANLPFNICCWPKAGIDNEPRIYLELFTHLALSGFWLLQFSSSVFRFRWIYTLFKQMHPPHHDAHTCVSLFEHVIEGPSGTWNWTDIKQELFFQPHYQRKIKFVS